MADSQQPQYDGHSSGEYDDNVFCVSRDEVDVESILGSGAYSTVYKVRLAPLDSDEDGSEDDVYALKKLHGKSRESQEAAAQDLLSEASLLADLPRHENIVTLYGVSNDFWDRPDKGFMLLDYLPETLESRLNTWKEMRHRDMHRRVLQVCLPVARAIAFLHRNNICYRDLKPENVGFDAFGNVRLYDFGFARLVKPGKLSLRHRVGTPRYMAPEVMKKDYYGKPSDVYSLAVMTWEVLMLKKPYLDATDFDHLIEMVADDHKRPALWGVRSWKEIKTLLSWAWHEDQHERPSARQVVKDMTRACQSGMKKEEKKGSSAPFKPLKLSMASRAA